MGRRNKYATKEERKAALLHSWEKLTPLQRRDRTRPGWTSPNVGRPRKVKPLTEEQIAAQLASEADAIRKALGIAGAKS